MRTAPRPSNTAWSRSFIPIYIITTVTMVGSKLESVFNYIGSTLDGSLQQ